MKGWYKHMKINDMIDALTDLKEEIGGDTELIIGIEKRGLNYAVMPWGEIEVCKINSDRNGSYLAAVLMEGRRIGYISEDTE